MKKNNSNFSTRTIHCGRNPEDQFGFVNTPVYRGSTIVFKTLEDYRHANNTQHKLKNISYALTGNPSSFALEDVMANIENGYATVTVSSGLAATSTVLPALLKQGDHLLVIDTVYGPTRIFCDTVLARYGIETEYFDPLIGSDIKNLMKDNTRCIYLESPGSLSFEICDTPAIAAVAKSKGIITVMDNTWASPYFYRPLEHGVNVSLCAATKYIVGHSDAMLGLITCDESCYQQIRDYRNTIGQYASPDDVFLGLRGIRTLALRMKQHHTSGMAVANWLRSKSGVTRVLHPALEECPGHRVWQRDFDGASGLFTFEVEKRSTKALAAFLNNMQLFSMGASWGAYASLISPVEMENMRTATCWPGNENSQLLRIHIGLECVDDLITDLDEGLKRYRNEN